MQMKCCGVVDFTDYEAVFNNFSVPVSCCNTTSSLASNCPDIVRNAQQAIDQIIVSDLVYTEVSRFQIKWLSVKYFILGLRITSEIIL